MLLLMTARFDRAGTGASRGLSESGSQVCARQAICTGSKTIHTLGEFVPPKTAKKPPNFVAQIGGASEITDRAGPLRIYCSMG